MPKSISLVMPATGLVISGMASGTRVSSVVGLGVGDAVAVGVGVDDAVGLGVGDAVAVTDGVWVAVGEDVEARLRSDGMRCRHHPFGVGSFVGSHTS